MYNGATLHRERPVSVSFIVYQYGKVASTALVETLNSMRHVRAHQCHFFGVEAFQATIARLCNPHTNDYFFKHSLGQLTENVRAYREYHRTDRADGERFVVVTVAREPFDWFQSAVLQEIEGHLSNFRLALPADLQQRLSDKELVTTGLALVIDRIHQTLDTVDGEVHQLTVKHRRGLIEQMPFNGAEDFEAFLFILSRYLQPLIWFKTQFSPEFGVVPAEMEVVGEGLRCAANEKGPIYLIQYEKMTQAFQQLLQREGLPEKKLKRVNEGSRKPLSDQVATAFQTPEALRLKARTRSDISSLFD